MTKTAHGMWFMTFSKILRTHRSFMAHRLNNTGLGHVKKVLFLQLYLGIRQKHILMNSFLAIFTKILTSILLKYQLQI